jgi:(p)ppGpp synthase/HD superfamily hydrolase
MTNEFTTYERALLFAAEAHGNQRRKYTGEKYIVHPIRVAAMVRQSGASEAAVAAALLHDVLEDTSITYSQLVVEFGEHIARLVAQLTAPAEGNRTTRKAAYAEQLRLADAEAQTIKVCDIIDNAASLVGHDPEFALLYFPEKLAQLKVLTQANIELRARALEICSAETK